MTGMLTQRRNLLAPAKVNPASPQSQFLRVWITGGGGVIENNAAGLNEFAPEQPHQEATSSPPNDGIIPISIASIPHVGTMPALDFRQNTGGLDELCLDLGGVRLNPGTHSIAITWWMRVASTATIQRWGVDFAGGSEFWSYLRNGTNWVQGNYQGTLDNSGTGVWAVDTWQWWAMVCGPTADGAGSAGAQWLIDGAQIFAITDSGTSTWDKNFMLAGNGEGTSVRDGVIAELADIRLYVAPHDLVVRDDFLNETYRNPLDLWLPEPRIWSFDVAAGASAAITGTAGDGASESEIVAGGGTIIITLTGDTWVAAGAAFDAERQNIIDGLDSDGVEATGWNAEVRDKEVVGAVVRTSDTVVTITLTAAGAYAITANETITVTVPASALVTSVSAVVATPTFDITNESAPAGVLAGSLMMLGVGT